MTDAVTRDEFRQLATRVDMLDQQGPRGIGVLVLQVQQLTTDLAKHEEKHDREAARQSSNRKWLVTAIIALVAAIDGPIVTVLLAVLPRH